MEEPEAIGEVFQSTPGAMPSADIDAEAPERPRWAGSITRYPSIRIGSETVPGSLLDIVVDLDLAPDFPLQGDPVIRDDILPADWIDLSVEVMLISAFLEFVDGDERAEIVVRRDRRSRPAAFRARLMPEVHDQGSFNITALFAFRGRHSGSARRDFPVDGPSGGTDILP